MLVRKADFREATRAEFNSHWAGLYREGDEQALTSDAFRHYGTMISRLSSSFRRDIDALDIGCGTGRYFHCLRNVRKLVGIDLSADMLAQAATPTSERDIAIGEIELRCGTLDSLSFTPDSFDFIYSIGVVGEYTPFDGAFVARVHSLLRPGGIALITVVDTHTRVALPEMGMASLPRRVLSRAFPLLPRAARRLVNRTLSPCYATRQEVLQRLREANFERFEITPYEHLTGWRGTHFDCVAVRRS